MTNDRSMIFVDNPELFREAAFNDDPEQRAKLLNGNFKDIVLCEVIRYGMYNQSEMIRPLQELYRKIFLEFEEEDRWEVFQHSTSFVQNVPGITVNALLPFIAEEPNRRIVASAVIDYVCVGPITDNDPTSRSKDIIGMIESGNMENAGAAFGGLLFLGDVRVCKLLWKIKDQLDHSEINEAVKCSTSFVHAASVEFIIDWLEGMEGDDQDGLFGVVASGLVLLRRNSSVDFVNTGLRQFPTPKEVSSAQQEANRKKLVPISEYTTRIAPRLYGLERTEPPPRVMPQVLSVWGLEPKSQPSEVAQNDDRIVSPVQKSTADILAIPEGQVVEYPVEWFDGEGQIYFTWALLNPNGPTLYCLGENLVNGKSRIFFRWLHMLGGATYYTAESYSDGISYQSIADSFDQLNIFLRKNKKPTILDKIPSFVIANGNDDILTRIIRDKIKICDCASKNWSREISYQRAFDDNFFARAGSEMKEFYNNLSAKPDPEGQNKEYLQLLEMRYGHIPDFKDAKIPQYLEFPLNDEVFTEWWNNIDTSEYRRSGFGQLARMWNGAISMMSEGQIEHLISFDKIIKFLAKFNLQIDQ